MEQGRANPCVFWNVTNKEVILILVVNVDDLLVSGDETVGKELLNALDNQFSTQNLGELEWYKGVFCRAGLRGGYHRDNPASKG